MDIPKSFYVLPSGFTHGKIYKTIKLLQNQPMQWVDEFMSFCLAALNQQREFTCVIAKHNDFRSFLITAYYLHADLTKDVLNLFLESESVNR